MKKCTYLLLFTVALVIFTGCKKENKEEVVPSVNYATLYSVLGKNASTAASIIKQMGYTYQMEYDGNSVFYASRSRRQDFIQIAYPNGVVESAFHSNLLSGNQKQKVIDYIKKAGETLKINGDNLPFYVGYTDDNNEIYNYKSFAATLGSAEYRVSAIWSSNVLHKWVQYYCVSDKEDSSSQMHFACYNFQLDY